MSEVFIPALLLAAGAASNIAWTIHFCRVRKGMFVIRTNASGASTIESDRGRFGVSPSGHFDETAPGAPSRTIPLADVHGIRYGYSATPATAAEMVFGFDVWDLWARFRDHIEWYEIAVVTSSGAVPVYVVGQLERREPLMAWWFNLVNRFLDRLHLRGDAQEQSLRALDQVLGAFKLAGKPLPLS